MRSRHLAWILFVASNSLVAQSYIDLRGTVIDQKSKQPLPFASVSIINSSIGTISNDSGSFELKVPENLTKDSLIVSYVGYRSCRKKISDLRDQQIFYLNEASVILNEVLISEREITAKEILEKAVQNLVQGTSYSKSEFELEGFYREVKKTNGKYNSLIEAAFSINDNLCTHPMDNVVIEEFRKILSTEGVQKDKKLYNHNNLMMLLGVSTNFVVLADHGLKNGKTAWAIGKRPYKIEAISSYNDKSVYVLTHSNDNVSLKIIIDAENFSIIRNEYHSKQPADDVKNYFWKYSKGSTTNCGFYETDQIYEYKEFQGKMYPYFFSRSDYSRCYDKKTAQVLSENVGTYQVLINQVNMNSNSALKSHNLKRHKSMAELNYEYHPEFWKNYTIIKELPLDESILKDLEELKVKTTGNNKQLKP